MSNRESVPPSLSSFSGLANYDAATLWREGRTSKEKTLFLILLFLGGEWTKMDSKVIHPDLVGWLVGSRDYKLGFLGGPYVQVFQNFIILLGGLVSLKLCTVSVLSKKSPPPFFNRFLLLKGARQNFLTFLSRPFFEAKGTRFPGKKVAERSGKEFAQFPPRLLPPSLQTGRRDSPPLISRISSFPLFVSSKKKPRFF